MGGRTFLASGIASLCVALAAAPPLPQSAAAVAATTAAGPIDFAAVPRAIGKQPALLAAKPLYNLFLFGLRGETRV